MSEGARAAEGAPATPFPPVSLYSLAVTVLEGAVEGVRQDSLTHELLERACANLADLPLLPNADPLRDPRYAHPGHFNQTESGNSSCCARQMQFFHLKARSLLQYRCVAPAAGVEACYSGTLSSHLH